MSYDPLKRDASWQMVLPGLYLDPAGCGHIFPDEFVAYLSIAHPEAGFDPNLQSDRDLILAFVQTNFPEVPIKFVKHDRQEN